MRIVLVCLAVLAGGSLWAQPVARAPLAPASLVVQVVDPSGAGIPHAVCHLGWNRPVAGGGGGRGGGGRGGDGQRGRPSTQAQGERRGRQIGFNISARNVFNRPQYGSFNGVITSPLFGRPVSAFNPRRIDVGVSLSF